MACRVLAIWAAAIAGLGCAGGDLMLPNDRIPARLAIESGDRQTGTAGAPLADPLVVLVTSSGGRAVEGATVAFSTGGDGAVSPATTITESDGRATARWTLDEASGTQRASARVVGEGLPADLTVTFTATVVTGTRTEIGTGPDPSDVGEKVTVFITVRGSDSETARGSVRVYDQSPGCGEGELLGQVDLNAKGKAEFSTTALEVGFHTIRGCYLGTTEFAPSNDTANQTVRED